MIETLVLSMLGQSRLRYEATRFPFKSKKSFVALILKSVDFVIPSEVGSDLWTIVMGNDSNREMSGKTNL